jgi:hypothetical protein
VKIALVYGAVTPPGRLSAALDQAAGRLAREGAQYIRVNLAEVVLPFAPGTLDERGRATVDAVASAQAMLWRLPSTAPRSPVFSRTSSITYRSTRSPQSRSLGSSWALRHITSSEPTGTCVTSSPGSARFRCPTSVYLTSDDFVSGTPSAAALEELDAVAVTLIDFVKRLEGSKPGPAPLAARA